MHFINREPSPSSYDETTAESPRSASSPCNAASSSSVDVCAPPPPVASSVPSLDSFRCRSSVPAKR
uniref:Uncharacterized protein n=1 Tax=Romanomermis culicivorax TaxID=13658 RepID=A0A915J4A4_ROMCU